MANMKDHNLHLIEVLLTRQWCGLVLALPVHLGSWLSRKYLTFGWLFTAHLVSAKSLSNEDILLL